MNFLLQKRFAEPSIFVVLLLVTAFPAAAEPFTVHTRNGPAHFEVEVARTPEEQERGLMHRNTLAADRGMLFLFGAPRPVTMWMKNTPLSLDMLFLTAEGRIARIEENTTPFSERHILSQADVSAVLEVPAGTARRIGAKAGDAVKGASFPMPKAALHD